MSTKRSESHNTPPVPAHQSSAQPDRPTPVSSATGSDSRAEVDAETYGEVPSGRKTHEYNKSGEQVAGSASRTSHEHQLEPKTTSDFADHRHRAVDSDYDVKS